jgi:hypothetical protein
MEIIKTLAEIQSELKAPKSQENTFGKYKYRSLEDIMEALKPVLLKRSASVTVSDEIVMMGDRFYVKATATLWVNGENVSTTAYARESLAKKGMDEAQITGSSSSYARKYAMNGLFAIDDTKDSDATNKHGKEEEPDNAEIIKKHLETCDSFKTLRGLKDWWKANSNDFKKELGQADASKIYQHMLENKRILEGLNDGPAE